ncbi:MAG: hypothetical protein QNI99_13965 [Woeseiaceae bacterium]|nr:hypothetical protein [Woeseiaceae bacterium]
MFKTLTAATILFALTFGSTAFAGERARWHYVSGSAIHYESEGIEHSLEPTAEGFIRRSTDIVDLSGDLNGRALFQPVSVINLVEGTMVNTGHQVFSGTVLDSDPVVIADRDFLFTVDLNTGETTGVIFLVRRVAGQRIRCLLFMQGTGRTAEGYNLSDYWGHCRMR